MNKRTRQPGFTLIELMLAMAVMSMLALSLYGSLRIAFKARSSATTAIGPVRAMSQTMELLRQDLESAMTPSEVLAPDGVFFGQRSPENTNSDILQFYCVGGRPEPDNICAGGIRKVELGVTTLSDGTPNVLVRHITDNLLAQVVPVPREEVICRGVRSFFVRHYDGEYWQDSWDSTLQDGVLPVAIEVNLEMVWPPELAASQTVPPENIFRISRIFMLPGHKDADAAAADNAAGTEAGTSGGATGGGATGGGATGGMGGGATGGRTTGGGR